MDVTSRQGPPDLPGNLSYWFCLSVEVSEALEEVETQDGKILVCEGLCRAQPHADPPCPKSLGYWGCLMQQ